MSINGPGGKKASKWTAWSGIVAVLSLVAALVFNGIQVRDSATAQRQAKEATELALLAQIQSAMTESAYSRVPYAAEFRELRHGKRVGLSNAAYRVAAEEGANMNYFAWLFNHGYLDAPGADELFGPMMVCEYQQAIAPALKEAPRELPDLIRFIQERGPRFSKSIEICQAR